MSDLEGSMSFVKKKIANKNINIRADLERHRAYVAAANKVAKEDPDVRSLSDWCRNALDKAAGFGL